MRAGSAIGIVVTAIFIPGGLRSTDLSSLIQRNPFGGPPPMVAKPQEADMQRYELRGVVRDKNGYLLNIYDSQTQKSVWLREGYRWENMACEGYDNATGIVSLEIGGGHLTLSLRKSQPKGYTSGAGMLATLQPEALNIVVQAAVAPPPGEVRRMEEVAHQVSLLRQKRQKTPGANSQRSEI